MRYQLLEGQGLVVVAESCSQACRHHSINIVLITWWLLNENNESGRSIEEKFRLIEHVFLSQTCHVISLVWHAKPFHMLSEAYMWA